MEIHFDNIKDVIIKELSYAKFNVFVSVAWIGEKFIINELTKCLQKGVQVEIIVNDDERFHKFKHKFGEFESNGGKIFLYDTSSSLMHNKFCVIDLCTTITGSFNWTYGATFHQENIIIERGNIIVAHQFAEQFIRLKRDSTIFSNITGGNVELAHKVKVFTSTIYSDDTGNGVILLLQEGKRRGILELQTDFKIDPSFIPSEINGFWRSKVDVLSIGETNDDENDYYEFICLDPKYIKYT
jgi:hypothetical protein